MQNKNKTIICKGEQAAKKWFQVDASGKVLGRLASKVAGILRGKHRPTYTPQADCGDYVVVINADKIKITGKKAEQKTYFRHSGYPGGHRLTAFEDMQAAHPGQVIELAVAGMLPKGRLGRKMIKKLKIVAGPKNKYSAQKLENLEV